MATDPRKRQKKLERRNAKRQEKKHQIVRAQPAGLGDRMTAAAKFPVLNAWVQDVFYTEGIGSVLLSRELPNGLVAVAVFMVDRYCLGVKNAFADILPRSTYESRFEGRMRKEYPASNVSPATVRKLIEAAVAYAGNLGFAPHPDYHKAKLLFGTIDASDSTETFEFGKDGKPFYFAGPRDTLQRSRQIVSILARKCGPDGFEYLIPFANPEDFLVGDPISGTAGHLDMNEDENLLGYEEDGSEDED